MTSRLPGHEGVAAMRLLLSRKIAPIAIALLVAVPGQGRSQVVIDAGRHHLGTTGQPEWEEFAGAEPEGAALERNFDAQANPGEGTLLIRQSGVKLGWD